MPIEMNHQSSFPHREIEKNFEHVYYVIGTSITHHEGAVIQHSSNMTIIRNGDELTLINTISLNEEGLKQLDALGRVKNIVRLGAFHGQDDRFYLHRYDAKLWALKGMKDDCGAGGSTKIDVEMTVGGPMPFPGCSLFIFESAAFPEAALHLVREGGILITCDSVKNWLSIDPFFNAETAKMHQESESIGPANIGFWTNACQVQDSDFLRLMQLPFRHLLSAHGEPLLNNAHEQLARSIKRQFGLN